MTENQNQKSTVKPHEKLPILDNRLATAGALLRKNSVVWDVGTDHAYIPIRLLLEGRCVRAVATDVHRGPLESAMRNAEIYGVADRITFLLADGLGNYDPAAFGVTDICLCGMGGELIASILQKSPFLPEKHIRLVLQPMSHGYDLRHFLLTQGYMICTEQLCRANGRIYTCMAAEYTGEKTVYSETELLLGRQNSKDPLWVPYLRERLSAMEKKKNGKRAGELDTSYEEAICHDIRALLREAERIML